MLETEVEVSKMLLILCLFFTPISGTIGELYVYEGQTVRLHFHNDRSASVSYYYKPVDGNEEWIAIKPDPRFKMLADMTSAHHTLEITDVQLRDAGGYGCADEDGEAEYIELIVTDSQLNCESDASSNHSEVEQLESDKDHRDFVKIRCNNIYSGRKSPLLRWTLLKDGSVLNGLSLQRYAQTTALDSGRYSLITSEITLNAESRWLDHSFIKCQLTEPENDQKKYPEIIPSSWLSENILVKCTDLAGCYIETGYATAIETGEVVYGITVMDEVIYVLQKERSKLKVYNSRNLEFMHTTYIPSLVSPKSLCSSAYNNTLYIVDRGHPCIHKVDLNNEVANKLKINNDYDPTDISLTAEHTLLVTVWIKGAEDESGVVEYTSDGELVREIRFEESIQEAHQTVQLSRNTFVVTHGYDITSLHRVCVVNSEGKIEKIYGGKPGSGDGKLYIPLSVAVDSNTKKIFVADTMNSRIVVLDFDLNYQGQVRTQLSPNYPMAVFFDSSINGLLVGEQSGRILVISP